MTPAVPRVKRPCSAIYHHGPNVPPVRCAFDDGHGEDSGSRCYFPWPGPGDTPEGWPLWRPSPVPAAPADRIELVPPAPQDALREALERLDMAAGGGDYGSDAGAWSAGVRYAIEEISRALTATAGTGEPPEAAFRYATREHHRRVAEPPAPPPALDTDRLQRALESLGVFEAAGPLAADIAVAYRGEPPAPPPAIDVERLAEAYANIYGAPLHMRGDWKRDGAALAREYARLGPAEDPQEPRACPTCNGDGWIQETRADPLPSGEPGEPYPVQSTCWDCGGSGQFVAGDSR